MPKRKRNDDIPEVPPRRTRRTENQFDQRHKIRCGVFHIPDVEGWYIEVKKVFSLTNPMLKEAVKLISQNLNSGYVKSRWGRTEHVAGIYCPKKRMRAALILVLDDDHVEIHTAATSCYYKRQHLASTLVALIIEWTRVEIVTRASDSPEVIRFWESMGFQRAKEPHYSSAPPAANERTVFMRHRGEKVGVLETKLPKFKPKKMKRIIIKHKQSGRQNVDLFIRKGEVMSSNMRPYPDRPPEMLEAIVQLAKSRTKKQMKTLGDLVKKMRPVTFNFKNRKSIMLYQIPKAKPKPKKKFVNRTWLLTVHGPGFEETNVLFSRKIAEDDLTKKTKKRVWQRVRVQIMDENEEPFDCGFIYRRLKSSKASQPVRPEGNGLTRRGRPRQRKRTAAATNKPKPDQFSHLTKDELLKGILEIDPSFKYDNGWCRYCGTTSSSGWAKSPWGSKKLCNSHGQKWRAGKLKLPEDEPNVALCPDESTELSWLRFKLKKLTQGSLGMVRWS